MDHTSPLPQAVVSLDVENHIATLKMQRPERRNALDRKMRTEIIRAIKEATAHARVLVLTGSGSAFSIGHDFDLEPAEDARAVRETILSGYTPLIGALEECPIPTIAAVNGPAIGAGVALALACDMTLARQGTFFSLPFAQLGMIPDCGAYRLLAQRVGRQRAMGAFLSGSRIRAEQAVHWGMIWDSLPREQFDEGVRKRAAFLTDLNSRAVEGLKALAARHSDHERQNWARDEADLQVKALGLNGT